MHLLKYDRDHFGRHGFKRHKSLVYRPKVINLYTLQDILPRMMEEKVARKRGDVTIVDLTKAGYDKLLSKGKVTQKLNIKVRKATSNSIEKIEKAGGKVKIVTK